MQTRVLVFCRPYLVPDFLANQAQLGDEFDFKIITDGRCPGVTDTRARFYARMASAPRPQSFTEADEREVIDRCRYLRHLPGDKALRMLRAMASVLQEEFESYAPQAVLAHMVDDYITHLMAEIARRRGLLFLGYAYSYFPQRIQLTQYGYGVPYDTREPDDAEVRDTLAEISQRTFRQNYLQKDTYTPFRHVKAMLRYRVKQVVFRLKAWRDSDPLHMHYSCLPYVVERRHLRDFPSDTDFHQDWRDRLNQPGKPIVYFPLGYFPEATSDYWIEDRRILQYQDAVLEICRTLGQHYRLVVKEHLHMLGARDTAFYRAMRDTPGVISVPPLEFSNDVLSQSHVVLMGGGSVGVEAFVRGKPLVSFCDKSYWFAPSRARFVPLSDVSAWPAAIEQTIAEHVAPTPEECFEFVRQCLRSTMRLERPGRVWPLCNPQDLKRALLMAVSDAAALAATREAPSAETVDAASRRQA